MEPSIKFHVSSEVTLVFVFFFTILILTSLSSGILAERDNDPAKFFSQYPGASESTEISQTLIDFWNTISSDGDSEEIGFKTYITPDPPDKVIDHYKDQEPGDGWVKTLQLPNGAESTIIAWKRNGESLQLVIGEDKGKTFILLGYGKKPTDDESNWVFYTEESGLIEDTATVIVEGKDGSIWFGTSDGLIQFVENEWKNYDFGPLERGVTDIAVAEDGDLWVGTWSYGLMYFDGETWNNITEREGLKNDRVSSIAIDSGGKVWVGSLNRKGGLSVYDGVRWTNYSDRDGLPSNYVHSVSISHDDRVWVGTKEGAAIFDGNNWKCFTSKDGLLDDEVEEVTVDSEGNLWAVSDQNVYRYDGGEWGAYPYENGIFGNKVFHVEIAPDGRVWFATKAGIACFTGDTWHILSEEDGLPDSYVLSVLVTTDGELWFGTFGDGIGMGPLPDFE